MAKLSDPWDHHDWSSDQYVAEWADRQDGRETERAGVFRLMADTVPYERGAAIRLLDVGAGYGALTRFLLGEYPNATAVCHDGSEEMAELGRQRMEQLDGRFQYALSDFSKEGWSRAIAGPFEAVVSSIAIHNVRAPEIIRSIYGEAFSLVKPGGCFLNFDRMRPSLDEQLKWLREIGFAGVRSFWEDDKRALVGGFKK